MIMPRGQQLLLPASPTFIWGSLLLALMLNLLPLGRVLWMPDVLAVVLVFWSIHQPRRVGLGTAFVFVLMLDVHHDIDVIEQRPPPFAGTLPTGGLDAGHPHLLLHLVHNRVDLPLVGRRGDHEAVGDHQLSRHVDDDNIIGQFRCGRARCDGRHRDRFLGGGHVGSCPDGPSLV